MLSAMHDTKQHGLDHLPKVYVCIAEQMLSPAEAHCHRPHYRGTDELLSWAYNTAARIGNSLSVLVLAQNRMLQPKHAELDLFKRLRS